MAIDIQKWLKDHKDDGFMHLYWRKLPVREPENPMSGWVYCETTDAAEALNRLIDGKPIVGHGGHGGHPIQFPVQDWELAWFKDGPNIIARSEDKDEWAAALRTCTRISPHWV